MFNSVMILAGGKGTRFAEYTDKIPKPMILANGRPLLDHIISIYSKFNINRFGEDYMQKFWNLVNGEENTLHRQGKNTL